MSVRSNNSSGQGLGAALLVLDALNFVAALYPRDAYRAGVLNLCRATRGEQFLFSAVAPRVPEVMLSAAAAGDANRCRFILANVGARRAAVAVACGARWPGITPLAVAAACGHVEVVRFLIAEGASVDGPVGVDFVGERGGINRSSFSRLHWAEKLRSFSSEEPLGPLHLAVSFDRDEIVNVLLDAGASINRLDCRSKRCPLNYALDAKHWQSPNPRLVALLIARGADVNNDNGECPPLATAVFDDHMGWQEEYRACIQLLVDAGADTTTDDFEGVKPLDRVLTHWHGVEPADMNSGYAATCLVLIAHGATTYLSANDLDDIRSA